MEFAGTLSSSTRQSLVIRLRQGIPGGPFTTDQSFKLMDTNQGLRLKLGKGRHLPPLTPINSISTFLACATDSNNYFMWQTATISGALPIQRHHVTRRRSRDPRGPLLHAIQALLREVVS